MLREVHVRDLALIEDVWLEFGPGMNVLTGETGAGKTALVGALKLLVGERADSTLVRAGSAEALVEGIVEHEGREITVKRRIGTDGRSRCTLDGEMATVGALAETLGPLVDLHGQHEHQALLQPARHVAYLDRFVGSAADEALATYRAAREAFLAAEEGLSRLRASLDDADRESDYLRFVVADIDAVAPTAGEDERIAALLSVLQHSGRLAEAAAEAFSALRSEAGASDAAERAVTALSRVSGLDPRLDAVCSRLGDALAQLHDVGSELRAYGEGVEHDPAALEEAQTRQVTLAGLKKKYGPTLADVAERRAEAAARLDAVGDGKKGLAAAAVHLEVARAAYESAADVLASVRAVAVEGFLGGLHEAVADLAMDGARFDVAITGLLFEQWGEDGPHRVEFTYAPGPDQPFRPLARIASGGELSRVMLALKGVLGRADDVPVLVFDEVDAGIGGATAIAVGRRLKSLAERHQVLVVTHLAQVAAFADGHLVVTKSVAGDGVRTTVARVQGEERVGEMARMLSGADTETSRAHASELLAEAAYGA